MADEKMEITTIGGQLKLAPIIKPNDVFTWVNPNNEDYIVGNFKPESPFEKDRIRVPNNGYADAKLKAGATDGQYTYTCSSVTSAPQTALPGDSVTGVVVVDTSGPPIEPKQGAKTKIAGRNSKSQQEGELVGVNGSRR